MIGQPSRWSQRNKLTSGFGIASSLLNGTGVGRAIGIGAKILYNSGLADRMTGGKATKVLKGFVNLFSPNKGVTQNIASQVKEAGSMTGTRQLSNMLGS